jgi:hypothetical protein
MPSEQAFEARCKALDVALEIHYRKAGQGTVEPASKLLADAREIEEYLTRRERVEQ